MYAIYSVKAGGWFTNSGTYSSEFADAKRLSREDAIAACAVHVSRNGPNINFGWLPVYVNDLEQVREHRK